MQINKLAKLLRKLLVCKCAQAMNLGQLHSCSRGWYYAPSTTYLNSKADTYGKTKIIILIYCNTSYSHYTTMDSMVLVVREYYTLYYCIAGIYCNKKYLRTQRFCSQKKYLPFLNLINYQLCIQSGQCESKYICQLLFLLKPFHLQN